MWIFLKPVVTKGQNAQMIWLVTEGQIFIFRKTSPLDSRKLVCLIWTWLWVCSCFLPKNYWETPMLRAACCQTSAASNMAWETWPGMSTVVKALYHVSTHNSWFKRIWREPVSDFGKIVAVLGRVLRIIQLKKSNIPCIGRFTYCVHCDTGRNCPNHTKDVVFVCGCVWSICYVLCGLTHFIHFQSNPANIIWSFPSCVFLCMAILLLHFQVLAMYLDLFPAMLTILSLSHLFWRCLSNQNELCSLGFLHQTYQMNCVRFIFELILEIRVSWQYMVSTEYWKPVLTDVLRIFMFCP